MHKGAGERVQTDIEIKRKAVKLVIVHLKKKLSHEFVGSDHVEEWLGNMDALLQKEEFNVRDYFEMRKSLNDVIESTLDEDIRFKLRDSWYSLGKALDKKAKVN